MILYSINIYEIWNILNFIRFRFKTYKFYHAIDQKQLWLKNNKMNQQDPMDFFILVNFNKST